MKRNADDVQVLSVTQNLTRNLNSTPYFGFTTGKVFFFLKNIHFFTFPCLSVLVDKGWGARSSLPFFIIASLYFIIVNLNMLIA